VPFPRCNRQPQWCIIHHIDGWLESLGENNVDNLVLRRRRRNMP
jgi:hypothetical protein